MTETMTNDPEIEECLRRTLPLLANYAVLLRRKGNQPTLERSVAKMIEDAQRALMRKPT